MEIHENIRALEPFEGREVVAIKAKITRAGEGLSVSLDAKPIPMHAGEEGFLAMKYVVGPIRFVPSKDDEETLIREQTYEAVTVSFIDDELVEEVIRNQEEKNRKRAMEKRGQFELPLPDGDDDDDL